MSPNRETDLLLILAPPVWPPEAPPMGLSYLHEHLTARGLRAATLDLNQAAHFAANEEQKEYWNLRHAMTLITPGRIGPVFDSLFPLLEPALSPYFDRPPAMVGFSLYHLNTLFACELARVFRSRCPDTTIIMGGPSNLETAERRKVPLDLLDWAVTGEAEDRLLRLARAVIDGRAPEDMPGLLTPGTYHDHHELCDLLVPVPLDGLAFPRYRQYDLSRYIQSYLPILTSRGCPFRCSFCNDHLIRYRSRSLEAVMDEIRHHYFVNGVTQFFFCDQTLDADVRRLEALADAVIASGLKIDWWGQLNVRKGLKKKVFGKLRESGCSFLSWGVESFSDPILRAMNKPSRAGLAVKVLREAHEAGIGQLVYLIVGFPGETDDTVAETMRRARQVQPCVNIFSLMPCQVAPFSPLSEEPDRFGIDLSMEDSKDNWRTIDGRNTPAQRDEWMRRICEMLSELGADFRSPIFNRERFEEILGRPMERGGDPV